MLENIEKVGIKGEVVSVKRGFARNFLIPRKHAIYATPDNMKKLGNIQAQIAEKESKQIAELKVLAEKLNVTNLNFVRKVDENEHMFGSVSENDIVNELKEKGIVVHKSMVVMDKHIKELGEQTIQIKLHKDISSNIRIVVDKEQD
jgi:large subunit ribosomal protein L9